MAVIDPDASATPCILIGPSVVGAMPAVVQYRPSVERVKVHPIGAAQGDPHQDKLIEFKLAPA